MRDVASSRGPFEAEARRLFARLVDSKIPEEKAHAVVESGYFDASFIRGMDNAVVDGYYGVKQSGVFEYDRFVAHLSGTSIDPWPRGTAVYRGVRDASDVEAILQTDRHRKYLEAGRLSFRGQTREYNLARPVPNPRVADVHGRERLILPAFWRASVGRGIADRPQPPAQSVFTSVLADSLVYRGIKDWETLATRNYERYGIHTMSDLEDFPDADSREYFKRWQIHKIAGPYSPEVPLLEQHYGMSTIGLDVTFDVRTALFFASNAFVRKANGKATYERVANGEHAGVLYCFVFRDPSVTRTGWLVSELRMFEHLPPVRPLRQTCAQCAFHVSEIGAAALDLDAVVYLDGNFAPADLPEAPYLFPTDDDPFYMALLDLKRGRMDDLWNEIVEYEW